MNPKTLPEVLRYEGEFGPEIITFVSFIYQLHLQGHLAARKVSTYNGMAPYYFFLGPDQLIFRNESRSFAPHARRWWPNNLEHQYSRKTGATYPNYRVAFANTTYKWAKPTLFIQNKFQVEWDLGPINYIPLNTLDKLCSTLSQRFQIVYSRPGIQANMAGYAPDDNTFCSYPDRAILSQYPEVLILEDLAAQGKYNETKLAILANAYHFVAVQGGGSHLLALYDRSVAVIYNPQGVEYKSSYWNGFYNYSASPAPTILVARSPDELDRYLDLLFVMPLQGENPAPYYRILLALLKVYQRLRRFFWLKRLDNLRAFSLMLIVKGLKRLVLRQPLRIRSTRLYREGLFRLMQLYGKFVGIDINRAQNRDFMWQMLLGTYEKSIITEMLLYTPKGGTFLDVGANVGYIARSAARKVGQKGRVLALEPNPVIFPTLKLNAERKGNIKPLNVAAGSEPGAFPFYTCEICDISSFSRKWLEYYRVKNITEQSVPVIRIEQVLEDEHWKTVDVIKIDVEGHEVPTLHGMGKFLDADYSKHIFIEINPNALRLSNSSSSELLTLLASKGYKIVGMEAPWEGVAIVPSNYREFEESLDAKKASRFSTVHCEK